MAVEGTFKVQGMVLGEKKWLKMAKSKGSSFNPLIDYTNGFGPHDPSSTTFNSHCDFLSSCMWFNKYIKRFNSYDTFRFTHKLNK